jgi:hypothetical protein
MAKSTKTGPKTATRKGKAREPRPHELIRKPDITAVARVRFDCTLFLRVTHPEYMPHEVMALVKRGQAQLDPTAPGQVGTLILDGFPYTVLGYYTVSEQGAEYEDGPRECSFHGPFYDFYRHQAATFQDMVDSVGEDFDKTRQATREMRENMAKIVARRQKRRQPKNVRRKEQRSNSA